MTSPEHREPEPGVGTDELYREEDLTGTDAARKAGEDGVEEAEPMILGDRPDPRDGSTP
ncbi:hypothetical protein [Longispora urticae]